jgi:hypothetical protein
MPQTIVFTQANLVGTGNNTFEYNFPSTQTFKNASIAVSNVSMYYAWFNISAALNNNSFQYSMPQSTGGLDNRVTRTVTIPDGLYNISDINNLLQYDLITANFYLVGATSNLYYASITINPTRYAVQLTTYAVPTALPAGYVAPTAGWGGAGNTLPVASADGQFTILATNDFYKIIGFTSPTYVLPYSTPIVSIATQTFLSNIAPQVQPNPSLLISITGIDNKFANPSSVIYSVTPSVGIGELITEKPPEFNYNRLLQGSYNKIRLQFLGSGTLNPVAIADPNILLMLVIKDEEELKMSKF